MVDEGGLSFECRIRSSPPDLSDTVPLWKRARRAKSELALSAPKITRLSFINMHWAEVRKRSEIPLQLTSWCTRDRRDGVTLADDLPSYDGHSGKFMLRLAAVGATPRRYADRRATPVRRSIQSCLNDYN
jgi:hypothetical protein